MSDGEVVIPAQAPEPKKPLEGTKTPKKAQTQVFLFDLRFHHDEAVPKEKFLEFLPTISKKWCFQLEKGVLNGYLHYQMKVSLTNKRRKNELRQLFVAGGLPDPAYCEPSAGKTFEYVMKIDTRVDGPWHNGNTPEWVPDHLRVTDADLRPWQVELLRICSYRDDRTINYVYCKDGNMGKSFVSSYLETHKRAYVLPPVNDSKDLMQALCCMLMTDMNRDPGIIFVDLPRAVKQYKIAGIYAALEQVKNGKAYDLRNTYKKWYFNPPAVVIFSNAKPYMKQLSRDRWKVYTLADDQLTPFFHKKELSHVDE